MTNEELVKLIQEGVEVQKNMGILYQQNEGYIRKLCYPFTERAEMDDLMQESYFGLEKAVRKFDPNYGCKFITYLTWQIRRACLKYIKNQTNGKRIPEYMQDRINSYKGLIKELEEVPTKETTMDYMGITSEQYDLMMITIYQNNIISIDEPISDDGLTPLDLIADETNTEEDYIAKECCWKIWEIIDKFLDERKKNIIFNHYREGKTLKEIAEELGVTYQYVGSLEKVALNELRKIDELMEYAEYFGYDSSIAYSGSGRCVEFLAMKHVEIKKEFEMYSENLKLVLDSM